MKVKILRKVENGPAPGKIVDVRKIPMLLGPDGYQIIENGPYLGLEMVFRDAVPVEILPDSPSINELVDKAHQNAVSKGWWDEERSFPEIAMLIVTEIAEAVEDYRAGHAPTNVWYEYKYDDVGSVYQELSVMEHSNGIVKAAEKSVTDEYTILGKPCGIPSELADVVIRVFDYCGRAGINLEAMINEKMAYNATRPHRHGGKKL